MVGGRGGRRAPRTTGMGRASGEKMSSGPAPLGVSGWCGNRHRHGRAGPRLLDACEAAIALKGQLMAHRPVRLRMILVCGALAGCLPGCQYAYDYELRGRIKSSSEGTPLAGVRITLEATSLFSDTSPTVTGADGSFSLRFSVSDGAFVAGGMPKWSLVLAREGYVEEVIDISPTGEPTSATSTNQIMVVAYMRIAQ